MSARPVTTNVSVGEHLGRYFDADDHFGEQPVKARLAALTDLGGALCGERPIAARTGNPSAVNSFEVFMVFYAPMRIGIDRPEESTCQGSGGRL